MMRWLAIICLFLALSSLSDRVATLTSAVGRLDGQVFQLRLAVPAK
jgi:hypothetical protein